MAFVRGRRRVDDSLEGTASADTIFAYSGNDTLTGLAGNDYMRGDEGNDSLDGGDGDDQIFGNDGDDEILGGNGNDLLNGGDGEDTFDGGDGDDQVFGNDGDDEILGGNGNDFLNGGNGNDSFDGGDGDDQVFGNAGDDEILGGNGNDLLNGGDGEDGLNGGDGNDTLLGGSNSNIRTTRDLVFKDDEGNIVFSGTVPTTEFIGGDTLLGGAGEDQIFAGAGDDIADGGEDNDIIIGGTGNDVIFAGTGDDEILGGADNDTLFGESGNDTLIGSSGEDLIFGDQDFSGGPDGDDDINAGSDNDTVYGGGGSDTILGGDGDDFIDGGDSRNFELTEKDENGNDDLSGGVGNDTIRGGLGRDTLDGGGTRSGEIDYLVGSGFFNTQDGELGFNDEDSDLFILGNDEGFLYAGGAGDAIETTVFGFGDRAIIQRFENGVDKIQVADPEVVTVSTLGTNSTFILIPAAGGLEIIAELENFTEPLAAGTLVPPPIDNTGDNNFEGTETNDLLDGGEGTDTLTGFGGDDTLDGGTGNDILDGSDGIDTVRYENDPAAVQVNLATQTATDGFGNTDTLLNIENVVGSAFSDIIIGDAQANNLNGGDGDDTFEGGAGNDILEGGDGIDTASYENDSAAVQVNLATQTATDGFGNTDTLLNIENVVGSALSDSIFGDAQANSLNGGNGDDTLEGGAGNDNLDGSDGIDTVSYQNETAGVRIELNNQTATDGFGNTDTLLNIESAVGSTFSDVIIGDAQGNNLNGGAGNDVILGNAGADFMVGTNAIAAGTGERDRLLGGNDGARDVFSIVEAGTNNIFYLGGGSSDYAQIEGFELGVDRIGINQNLLGNLFFGNSGNNAVLGFRDSSGGVDVVAFVVGINAQTLSQQQFLAIV